MIEKLFTNKEMQRITGEQKPRIQYWVLKGVFRPALPGKGMGSGRRFSFGNLLEIAISQALATVLPNVSMIAVIMRNIRRERPSLFGVPSGDPESHRESILSVLIQSPDAVVVYVHDLKEAREVLDYLSKGFKIVHFDLDLLRRDLLEKVRESRS
jgi:hypothetical protein